MSDLARAGLGVKTPIKEISERQGISEKYLEQIVRALVRDGLVVSSRGSQGGYELARPPRDITVGQILRSTEGDLAPVSCVALDGQCDRAESCETIFVWRRIGQAIDEVVDGITLTDVIQQAGPCDPRIDFQI